MTEFLGDGNLLVALTVSDHIHHEAAHRWFDAEPRILATCPITQGTLLRFLIREGVPAAAAVAVLSSLAEGDWHRFWPDSIPFGSQMLRGVIGHRQVTDAYLVALAGEHGAKLATFDRGLAALHGEVVTLVDT